MGVLSSFLQKKRKEVEKRHFGPLGFPLCLLALQSKTADEAQLNIKLHGKLSSSAVFLILSLPLWHINSYSWRGMARRKTKKLNPCQCVWVLEVLSSFLQKKKKKRGRKETLGPWD